MSINFPASPTVGQTYSYGSSVWTWNGSAWDNSTASLVGLTVVNYVDGGASSANTDIVYDPGTSGSTTTNWTYFLDAGASITTF